MIEAIVAANKWKWRLYKADIAENNSLAAKPLGTKKNNYTLFSRRGDR